MLLVGASALGLPGWPANVLVSPEEPVSYCGSPEMDDYFNSKCGGAVNGIVGKCCDENPAPEECDTFRMACINAHVNDDKCASADDCDAGCEFFNSVAASCCPHVRSRAEQHVDFRRAVVKAGEPEEDATRDKEESPPKPACFAISNDEYYNKLSGGMLANITSTCCGYAAVVTGMPSTMKLNFPAACDDYMRQCNRAQVKLGACDDEEDCDMGMQVMNQIIDSCCHRPSQPPSPPPPARLCAAVDSESTSATRDVAALLRRSGRALPGAPAIQRRFGFGFGLGLGFGLGVRHIIEWAAIQFDAVDAHDNVTNPAVGVLCAKVPPSGKD